MPGSTRLNGRSIPDFFEYESPDAWQQLSGIVDEIFADGQISEIRGGVIKDTFFILGPHQTLPDGTSCTPVLLVDAAPKKGQAQLFRPGCDDNRRPGQTVRLSSFDPADLASVRTDLAAQAGIGLDGFQNFGGRPENGNLEFKGQYRNTGFVYLTLRPR